MKRYEKLIQIALNDNCKVSVETGLGDRRQHETLQPINVLINSVPICVVRFWHNGEDVGTFTIDQDRIHNKHCEIWRVESTQFMQDLIKKLESV